MGFGIDALSGAEASTAIRTEAGKALVSADKQVDSSATWQGREVQKFDLKGGKIGALSTGIFGMGITVMSLAIILILAWGLTGANNNRILWAAVWLIVAEAAATIVCSPYIVCCMFGCDDNNRGYKAISS